MNVNVQHNDASVDVNFSPNLAMAALAIAASLWQPFAMATLCYGGPSLCRPFAMSALRYSGPLPADT